MASVVGAGLVITSVVACGGTSGIAVGSNATADTTATVAASAVPAVTGDFAGLVDIGGRGIYLECIGSGSPTVILESGQWHNGQVWTEDLNSSLQRTMVQPQVAEFARVCSYDRPGTTFKASRSDPVPLPRSADSMVAELDSLIAVAGIPGPFVVVGHSLGGILVRMFANSHRGEVVGMVLVDAAHEDYPKLLTERLTPDQQAALNAAWAAARYTDEVNFDEIATNDLLAEPLSPMPLVVLSEGRRWSSNNPPELYPPGYPTEVDDQIWVDLQNKLAELVPGAVHTTAFLSGHAIHLDEPAVVVAAVRSVVDAVRAGQSTPVTPTS